VVGVVLAFLNIRKTKKKDRPLHSEGRLFACETIQGFQIRRRNPPGQEQA
jgi:hypothetical protein